MNIEKKSVYYFWNKSSCGEDLYLKGYNKENFEHQSSKRYELEPYINNFAEFEKAKNKKFLEIGVGLGADHQKFVEAGAESYGIDLTERSVEITKMRLNKFSLKSKITVGDAENLNFENNFFDIVYSWGVIHHSPNTPKAVKEIYRVLKKNGVAKIMIYHKWSLVGFMLWIRYALLRLKPFMGLNTIYAEHLESPGTKAYSKNEALSLFSKFSDIKIKTILTHGDLLYGQAGQRHKGIILSIARKILPRKLIKKLIPNLGLFMLIELRK